MDVKEFISFGLALVVVGVIPLAYLRHRRRAKADSEKRVGEARRRRFIEVAQEKRSGLQRRDRDRPQGEMGNIVTDEVDPLAEAEAYLSRGRDSDAESVLKEAIAKDPARYELKLKLLAIYGQRHDASAFDPLAQELYAALGGRHGEPWDRLEAMGCCLNPHNRVPRADSGSVETGSSEPLQETAFQREDRRRQQHADLTALALAKTYLDMNDNQRALGLLNEALAHLGHRSASKISSVNTKPRRKTATDIMHGGVATQRDVSAIREYGGVERRKRSRRTIANHRDATSWCPNAADRRKTPGRRREDRL